jgi:hypothetical protein
MNNRHDLRSLVEWENGYIGHCSCCGTYNVAYKNSLFVLKAAEFDWFREVMLSREYLGTFQTTHGKEIYVPTPLQNYFILFSEDELTELLEKLAEVSPLVQADQILNKLA